MMPIGIDYTAAVQQTAGIGRYVRGLTAALADQHPTLDARLFVAGAHGIDLPPAPGGFRYRPSALSERAHTRLWHRLRLPVPVEAWTGRVGLFHAMDFTLPPTLPGTRTVLTVYDLAYERYPDETMPGMQHYLATVVPRSVRRADRVIAISEATRRDLIDLYGTPLDKLRVVTPGVESRFNTHHTPEESAAVRSKYGLPDGPLVLTVGTMQPRKNHRRLVQAFARVRQQGIGHVTLVIAGGKGWAYEDVWAEVRRLRMSDRVAFIGFVDDADLPALYRAATVFAYPALHEGFGLPVLEAMACGVPVVASNTSSLPEVTGADGALLVDPLDVEALAEAIERLLADDALRVSLRERGLERAAGFTWERSARALWAVYEELIAGG